MPGLSTVEIATLAAKLSKKPEPAWMNGTVQGGALPGSAVAVILDIDAPNGNVSYGQNLTGMALRGGGRVACRISASGGLFVEHPITPAATLTLVASTELTTDGPLVLTVPDGYRHITLRASVRSAIAAATDTVFCRLNGVTGANLYQDANVFNFGGSASAQAATSRANGFKVGDCEGSTGAGVASPVRIECHRHDILGSKEGFAECSRQGTIRYSVGWIWWQPAPITSLQLCNGTAGAGVTWKSGSSAYLYAQ